MTRRRRLGGGFTLIELLVVVAIIALLISILLPSLNKAKENGRRAVCMANLHHLGLAFENYFNDYGHVLPVAGFFPTIHSADPEAEDYYPAIMDILEPYARDQEIWHCPSDMPGRTDRADEGPEYVGKSYFQMEGTSYEYNMVPYVFNEAQSILPNFAKFKVKVNVGDAYVEWGIPQLLLLLAPSEVRKHLKEARTSDFYLLKEYENYHGTKGVDQKIIHTLYADNHVSTEFVLPFGIDPNDPLGGVDPNSVTVPEP